MSSKIRQALEVLRASNLFTDEELEIAKVNMHECELNPYTHPGVVAVGVSPNKTGEIIGDSGKKLQVWCKGGRIVAYQDYQGWWTIPVNEIVRLKQELKEDYGKSKGGRMSEYEVGEIPPEELEKQKKRPYFNEEEE